ncbi:MAG TPA: hypothetical protein VJT81_04905 [Burkholderiales bacterium]|nr:hypothetical protein [Burkholderiales bacterium]
MNNTPFDRVASDCMAKKIEFPEQLAKQYVRILQKINELWGLPAAITYLDELIMPSRIDRQGFSPDVALELATLKQLHEYTYPVRNLNTWDPYYYVNRERFKGLEQSPAGDETPASGEISATGKAVSRPRPSVYKSWFATKGSRQLRNSPIGSLYPAKGFTERTTNPSADPSSNFAVEEILMDAEDLLGIRRIHSAIALYEQAIGRYAHYSAYPHLRLLELYYDLDRREEFERVARQFSAHFSIGPIRWVLIKAEFWAQLDRIAAALLQKTMAQVPQKTDAGFVTKLSGL